MTERSQIVTAARDTIAQGSQSFAAASKLFAPATRERAWLLYAWCRAADDLTDGQELGHNAALQARPEAAQAELEVLTRLALDSSQDVPPAFAALRLVAHETAMPRSFIADHLAGFALDAAGWRPQTREDLLQYCYHVAGTVGCMMAVVMGVSPEDDDTLDRACDLGLAFQLANIARDIVPDAQVGRCYLPAQWLKEAGLSERDLADPRCRKQVAILAQRLVEMSRPFRRSARVGAARLPVRSRLAVLAADGIYGSIGEKVLARGSKAWDQRVRIGSMGKLGLLALAALRALGPAPNTPRGELWTRQRQS
ncbi:MAG: phytoene/squalene synthase family protein [Alphaproteobacteria bacterium]